jgi:hypothetical protein
VRVIIVQPVLEAHPSDGFSLWPVAEAESYDHLPLSGELSPAEVGTAVMSIAGCNNVDPPAGAPPRPADPVAAFLHGLLTMDDLFAAGGLRVTDTATGIVLLPGCCIGLEDWRNWSLALDGGPAPSSYDFGHDPSPTVERVGETVRLTVDGEQDDSPVIEVTAAELRHLLAGAEKDLTGFLNQVSGWAARELPGHATSIVAAVSRALDIPPRREPLA